VVSARDKRRRVDVPLPLSLAFVKIGGRNVSVSIEDPFWNALKEIADIRDIPRAELIPTIKSKRQYGTLSSALRLFVLDHYRALAERR
jgi:predicted DNA-binding ribbon-helix-helix protein